MIERPRHDLDEAIDRVAAKMVAADADAGVLHRVLAQLPERAATPWFLRWPVQAAAAAAIVLVAFLFARPSRELVSIATPPLAERAVVTEPRPIVVPPQLAAAPVPVPRSLLLQRFGRQALIPDLRSPLPDPRPDHARSLPPVDAIGALELVQIAPPAMELEATAVMEPLVLPELALDPQGES